jgi:predicted GNAT family acetyltransferase
MGGHDTVDVVRAEERSRFEALLETEVVGFIDYESGESEVLTLTHTEVLLEGQGIGSRLAKETLDHLLQTGETFHVTCPFIRGWIRRHEEYLERIDLHP